MIPGFSNYVRCHSVKGVSEVAGMEESAIYVSVKDMVLGHRVDREKAGSQNMVTLIVNCEC